MASVVNTNTVNFLERKRLNCHDTDIADIWQRLQDLYIKRLWHQLTLELNSFMNSSYFNSGDELLEIYQQFISDIELRLGVFDTSVRRGPRKAINKRPLHKRIRTFQVNKDVESIVLCKTAIGRIYLARNDLNSVKRAVDETAPLLDEMQGITSVHAQYYDLCSKCCKMQGDFSGYFADALRFLGCIDLKDMTLDEQKARARDLSFAALLADNLFNLGELLVHPILNSLRKTNDEWIIRMLLAFNKGDHESFENLKPYWKEQTELAQNEGSLRQKLALFGLVELTFHKPANNRVLSFKEISHFTKTPLGSVEMLVMKAFARGLLEGKINQVFERAEMIWVRPRVLDLSQLTELKEQISSWSDKVRKTVSNIEEKSPEVVA
ncbi:26S proteasome non-ATPase regulatory subunit 13 [Trichoplax sp. H2]|nr:26S proteasome non-ATPase regulatory subunit 13 [Trichoplax sp. H2]|eukprot:RDD41166.1 26S proteasome non-ATPase regulatory subunit 13 [Trichoplax sp. H2]